MTVQEGYAQEEADLLARLLCTPPTDLTPEELAREVVHYSEAFLDEFGGEGIAVVYTEVLGRAAIVLHGEDVTPPQPERLVIFAAPELQLPMATMYGGIPVLTVTAEGLTRG